MSGDNWTNPNFGRVPQEYDKGFFDNLVRQIGVVLTQMHFPGDIEGSTIRLEGLPTSPSGLKTGQVWVDNGVLKIVFPSVTVFPSGTEATSATGIVTVSTP